MQRKKNKREIPFNFQTPVMDLGLLDFQNRHTLFNELAEGVVREALRCFGRVRGQAEQSGELRLAADIAEGWLKFHAGQAGQPLGSRIHRMETTLSLRQAAISLDQRFGEDCLEIRRARKLLDELLVLVCG